MDGHTYAQSDGQPENIMPLATTYGRHRQNNYKLAGNLQTLVQTGKYETKFKKDFLRPTI